MPIPDALQRQDVAMVLKQAVAYDGLDLDDRKDTPEAWIKEIIRRNGWLHAERSNYRVHYVFPSSIHRWYCSYMLHMILPTGDIPYITALELVIATIKGILPCFLSDSPRSSSGQTIPLEDQYQKEFYRSFYMLLGGHVLISPEYIAKTGKGGGTIDFLVSDKKWGFELLRNGDRLTEHMDRFKPGGAYYGMIQSNIMQDYIVLDFSILKPAKPHPEYQGHLYHVVFSNSFRDVSVIDVSDLQIITSFTLLEKSNPLA